MKETKRNKLYWIFKLISIFISCALPSWAIWAKFPIWTEQRGVGRSIGAGLIMICIVLVIVFRRTVFDYIREHLNVKHAPPLTIWLVLIIISYTFIYIADVLRDMNTVFWWGFIGCAIGTLFTYIAENCFRKKDKDNE